MRRSWVIGAVLAVLLMAGCGGGRSNEQEQRLTIRALAESCRGHGGVGYLNFDNEYPSELDEATCADATRLHDGEPVE